MTKAEKEKRFELKLRIAVLLIQKSGEFNGIPEEQLRDFLTPFIRKGVKFLELDKDPEDGSDRFRLLWGKFLSKEMLEVFARSLEAGRNISQKTPNFWTKSGGAS